MSYQQKLQRFQISLPTTGRIQNGIPNVERIAFSFETHGIYHRKSIRISFDFVVFRDIENIFLYYEQIQSNIQFSFQQFPNCSAIVFGSFLICHLDII